VQALVLVLVVAWTSMMVLLLPLLLALVPVRTLLRLATLPPVTSATASL
jgi:hypothetical protein